MNLNPFSGGSYKNPADDAMKYLEQIPGEVKPYYDPYINAGGSSLDQLMQQYNMLVNNPGNLMSSIGEGFTQSPGYQFQYNQGMNAANAAAASGGMLGTPYHQNQAASISSNLANQDFYNYLQTALQQYNAGLKGYEGINSMGYNASNELANTIGNNRLNQANMSYLGTSNQNQANADAFKALLGGGATVASAFI